MSGSIKLSPKHGLNPSMLQCPICAADTNGIALVGRLKDDAEAPKRMLDNQPCAECQEHMAMGFLLIEATPLGEEGFQTTGRRWVVTMEAAERIFAGMDLSKRCARIEPEVANHLGLDATPSI